MTNTGVDILLFWVLDDWGRYGRTYEQIATHLARAPEVNQVVCMFPPAIDDGSGPSRLLRERHVSSKLVLLTEVIAESAINAGWVPRVRARAQRWLALRRYLGARGFARERTILWLFPPHPYIDLIRIMVPHRRVVAHVIDDFTKFDPAHWLYPYAIKQYPKIGGWADVIFTASEANHVRFRSTNARSHRFAQAVDESFIATPSMLPHRLTGARPRLGYLGFLTKRTDLGLLRAVAERRHDWDFVLAGPEYPVGYVEASGVLQLPNVRWLGELPYAEVPRFLQSLDVCLMPHFDNAYAQSMAPLKLYQYLGSGRPIVSTPVPGIEFAEPHVRVAGDAAEFVQRIQDCLDDDGPEHGATRIDFVRTATWRVRVAEMLRVATGEENG